MTYHIITYGCQMNHSDSERIAAVLEKTGYRQAGDEKSADLIVVNACSVRQSAVDRIFGQIQNINQLKTINHKLKTILTGCILEKDRKKLADKSDLILNIKDLPELPKLLQSQTAPIKAIADIGAKWLTKKYLSIQPNSKNKSIAYIPISTGCNNFCSYCVVPCVRGPEQCRPAKEIIREIKQHIKNGCKEIWLLGQNVNSYSSHRQSANSEPPHQKFWRGGSQKIINFSQLLKLINDIPGDFWIKFISSHPKDMSDELTDVVAKCEKVCKYIHLPIQSGDNTILRKMNRHYTVAHYKNLIKKIRNKISGVAISTDIIVGFPGETKKQFENTAKLMREIKFDMAYLAQYSPRSSTAASYLKDNVSPQEKHCRENILNEILKKTALENNKKYIGQTFEILIESTKNHFLLGRTKTHKNVRVELIKNHLSCKKFIGSIIRAKISTATPWGLSAKIII